MSDDNIRSSRSSERDFQRLVRGRSSDAFGKIITDSTTNTLDLPSAYPFSPERYRYNINGTVFRKIGSDTRIAREEGSFILQPDSGDTISLYSAERPRYVVGYEALASMSTKLNTSLNNGDTVRIGINDFQSPENAAFFELNGDPDNDRIVLVNEGTEVATSDIRLPDEINRTDPLRWEIKFNWYGVGRYEFTVSHTDDGQNAGEKQRVKRLGELVVDTDYSTSDPNKHVFGEIDTASGSTGREFEVGSLGYNVLGDVIPTSRIKSSRLTGLSYGGSGDFEAVAAARIDPDFGNVFSQIKNIQVFPDKTQGELLAVAVDPDDTDASGFSTPVQQTSENSVWLETTNVSTFPDESGSVVSSASDPNGRQVGFSSSDVSGQGSSAVRGSPTQTDKRPVYEDDRVIFLYKADSATADTVNLQYQTQQFW